MKVGVLSDIHANEVALSAVLDDMPSVDALVCAGDVVGYNPWPGECVDRLRERAVPTIMGNHDRAVVTNRPFRFNEMAKAGIRFSREQLSEDQLAWLENLPETRVQFDGRVKIVHGHPEDPDYYTYPEEFGPHLLGAEDVLVMGHTHVQHAERYEEGVVLNPGSVGQPRDGDPRAAYAIVDLDDGDLAVDERRVEYDVSKVRTAIEEAGLPSQLGARLVEGR